MLSVKEILQNSIEIKGSTFIAFLIPIEIFDTTMQELREKHSKAVHFVSATRFFNTNSQIEESFSDDGEPRGTSGIPTLKVLRGYELIECGVITIRYFGGTLLGTGGLVRAYTQACKEVIILAKEKELFIEYEKKIKEKIFVGFSHIAQVEYLLKKYDTNTLNRDFIEKGVILEISANKEKLESFLQSFKELQFNK